MQKENKIEKYKNKGELDLETIVNEYNGYVYKIIENMVSKNIMTYQIIWEYYHIY